MFLGIGDVHVNLRKGSSLGSNYFNMDNPVQPINMYSIRWTLEVTALDVEIEVSADAHPHCPQEIATSCLLAGLKNVSDSVVYDAACAKLETQLGFAVDRWISPKITKIEKEEHDETGAYFRVSVIPKLFDILAKEPVFTAHLPENNPHEIEITMDVDCGKKIRSSLFFSRELWEYSSQQCVDLARHKMVSSLYEEMPELSHLWTQIRYNLFDMKHMSAETIHWYNSVQGKPTPWMPMGYIAADEFKQANHKYTVKKPNHLNPAAEVSYLQPADEEDRRVKELPALNEMVKHPITGQTGLLKNVIISLNDASRWTREQIADWLETLDIDITFKVKTDDKQD